MIALRMNSVGVVGLNDISSGWQTHLGAAMVQWFKTDSAVRLHSIAIGFYVSKL